MKRKEFQISFADLCVGFSSEFPIAVPDEFRPFLTEGGMLTDHYRLEKISQPLHSDGRLLYSHMGVTDYEEPEGNLIVYNRQSSTDLAPGIRLRQNGEHTFYITEELEETLRKGSRLGGVVNGEGLLLRHDGLLLHSSLVCHKGRGVLFSGPCGIGKSTQADLWNRTFGDKIINGDRAVVRLMADGFYAGGSPWCGSSGIYCPDYIPIEAIILLRQGPENRMVPAIPKIAFRELYSQCIVHGWDRCFVDRVCGLLQALMDRIPVYCLTCVPEASAALLAENIVFRRKKG